MGEIYEFSNKTLWELEDLMEKLSDEYDDLEDQLLDLEEYMFEGDNAKDQAEWKEEYTALENRMAEIEKEYDELQARINALK